MRTYVLVLSLLALGSANAAERQFAAVPTDGQQVRYVDGEAFLVTETARAVLSVAYVPKDKKSALLKVGVANLGADSFNFAETSVNASSAGASLPVMSYRERLAEQKKQERWAGVAAALGAAANNMNAANAGYESSYGTYSSSTRATVYGAGGTVRGNASTVGSYYGRNYNATAAEVAKASADIRNQALFDEQQANAEFARMSLEDRVLKANTLEPGQSVVGDVQFALPKRDKTASTEFTVTIDVAGQPVTVLFREQQ